MISLKKVQLVIIVVLACIIVPVLAAEPNGPNEPKTALKFETKSEFKSWIRDRGGGHGRGPIKPTHLAVLYILEPTQENMPEDSEGVMQILNTSYGKSLSEKQQEFLKASSAIMWIGTGEIQNHEMYYLYAVSEEDAKKTVEAFLEIPTKRANERMQEFEDFLQSSIKRLAEDKNELPKKEAQLEYTKVKYENIKNKTHSLFSDKEASEEAKQTILEMNKKLDALNIETTGIEARLSAVERYKSRQNVSIESLAKLEQILSEQTVELAGALARKDAAIKIRTREEEFYNVYHEWSNIESDVNRLKRNITDYEDRIKDFKELLANPGPYMLPPKIYRNTVTIYPVRSDN